MHGRPAVQGGEEEDGLRELGARQTMQLMGHFGKWPC